MVIETATGPVTEFSRRIARLHEDLGISPDYAQHCRLPLYPEPRELADAGEDMFGRAQQMVPDALAAWRRMQCSARKDGVTLLLVSAFRSVDYQADLIRRKLASGRSLEDVLRVNAAPGFSEHHTGRAIDIATDSGPPLETSFECTAAFGWLCTHAEEFGFVLSYPKESTTAISYEPWHWCFKADQYSA
jgi:zinc D-Ala-D-Ala carboxypeptidase